MCVLVYAPVLAGEIQVSEELEGSRVTITVPKNYFNAKLVVTGPNRFQTDAFSKGTTVSVDLIKAGGIDAGVYRYEVSAASTKTTWTSRSGLNNGRGPNDNPKRPLTGVAYGTFTAKDGIIVKVDPGPKEED
ncbi:MAG: hypothetical protein KDJ80_07000 [Nitratireductor sp.]|nr:hypothetical protein [Nitratireductor sp.]